MPPMMAPVAAKPELPRNLRRLTSDALPFAESRPVSRSIAFLPCRPLPGFCCRVSLRKTDERVFAFCGIAARPRPSCGHGIATRDVATNTR